MSITYQKVPLTTAYQDSGPTVIQAPYRLQKITIFVYGSAFMQIISEPHLGFPQVGLDEITLAPGQNSKTWPNGIYGARFRGGTPTSLIDIEIVA